MFRRLDKVQNKKVWRLWFVLLIEFIGTFAMVFEIIAPSALQLDQFAWYQNIFGTYIMKAFWVAGFILILIFLLRWVSVNLNPAVTLSEVAVGNTSKQQAAWMILFQFAAAFLAAYAAFWMGTNMEMFNTAAAANNYIGSTDYSAFNADAVYPVLRLSGNEQAWFGDMSWYTDYFKVNHGVAVDSLNGTFTLWGASWEKNSSALGFLGITFLLEMIYTWLLCWSVVGAKKVSHNARPFLIFAVLMVVVALGIHTNNIALNPARLVGPAVVTAAVGGVNTLPYVLVFLFGELAAVLLIAKTAGRREYREAVKAKKAGVVLSEASDIEAFKNDVKTAVIAIQNDVANTKANYKWVLEGNNPIETMDKEELLKNIKAKKADKLIEETLDIKELRKEFTLFLALGSKGFENAKKEAAAKEAESKKESKKDKKGAKKVAPKKEAPKKAAPKK